MKSYENILTFSLPIQATDDDEEDEDDDELAEDEFKPIKSRDMSIYGKPGTKDATVQWFKQTQSIKLRQPNGQFAEWFHGIITRRYIKWISAYSAM